MQEYAVKITQWHHEDYAKKNTVLNSDASCHVEVRVGSGDETDGSEHAHQVVKQHEQVCAPRSPKQQQPSATPTVQEQLCSARLF